MDFKEYQSAYFTDPAPPQRFAFKGIRGITLYYHEYESAVLFYKKVFGEPAYVEGDSTKGWQIGTTWLTLLRGQAGRISNIEVMLYMEDAEAVDRVRESFINAGAEGSEPVSTLMYEPVYISAVVDPFGANWMIISAEGA